VEFANYVNEIFLNIL